jgi:hypothetical protein
MKMARRGTNTLAYFSQRARNKVFLCFVTYSRVFLWHFVEFGLVGRVRQQHLNVLTNLPLKFAKNEHGMEGDKHSGLF